MCDQIIAMVVDDADVSILWEVTACLPTQRAALPVQRSHLRKPKLACRGSFGVPNAARFDALLQLGRPHLRHRSSRSFVSPGLQIG